jgi:hypothetical protein
MRKNDPTLLALNRQEWDHELKQADNLWQIEKAIKSNSL